MLLYKVILSRDEQKEIIYRSISSRAKLPDLEITLKHAGATLVITTCDLSSLDAEEMAIYHEEMKLGKFPKAA